MGKRIIDGLLLTVDGDMVNTPLEVEGRILMAHKMKRAWLLEVEPHSVMAARRGKYRQVVIVNDEHPVPARSPWQDPTAATPEHAATFRERNRRIAGQIMKKRSKTDLYLTINMILMGGMGALFAFVTIAYVDIGGLFNRLPI